MLGWHRFHIFPNLFPQKRIELTLHPVVRNKLAWLKLRDYGASGRQNLSSLDIPQVLENQPEPLRFTLSKEFQCVHESDLAFGINK